MFIAKSGKRLTLLVDLLSLTYFGVVFGLIWVPFGLKKTIPLYEEWYFAYVMDVAPLKSIANNATRPIFLWPYYVAHLLTPNSFAGLNLLLITVFILKAVFTYRLLRHLVPENSFLAFITATLCVIYPVDTGLLSFRALSFHVSLLLTIIAIYFFVVGWNKNKQWPYWVVIWILQMIILATYEALYPLIFVAPVLLLWLEKKLTRPVLHAILRWSVIPLIYFILTVWAVLNGVAGYINVQYDSTRNTNRATLIKEYRASIEHMYRSHIYGWSDAFKEWHWHSNYLWLALLAGLLTAILSWVHLTKNQRKTQSPRRKRQVVWLLLAGLSIMLLGFAAFVPSPFNQDTFRVFYATSLGAALVVATLVSLLARIRYVGKPSAILLTSLAVTIATSHTLDQHRFFAESSNDVAFLYTSIIEQAPHFPSGATLFVIDEAYQYQDEWHLASHSTAFQGGLRYLYHNDGLRAKICVIDVPRAAKICEFRDQGVYYLDDRGATGVVPYERAIIFRTAWNGKVELLDEIPLEYVDGRHIEAYNPHALIDSQVIPERTLTALSVCWPPSQCERRTQSKPETSLVLEFDQPINGFGWEYPYLNPPHLWMTNEVSTIHCWLVADHDLQIQFKIALYLAPDVIESLRLEVNGDPIPLSAEGQSDGVYFTGIIPQSTLMRDPQGTTLRFFVNRLIVPAETGNGPDERPLALLFDSLKIGPMGN